MARQTLVAIVLDCSESMGKLKRHVIDGYNEFLSRLGAEPAEIQLTQVQFSNCPSVYLPLTPLGAVPRLDEGTYEPSGMTALYDGIMAAIAEVEPHDHEEQQVLVFIITDGDNNASQTSEAVATRRMDEKRATRRWRFVLMGTPDAHIGAVASRLRIPTADTHLFDPTAAGVHDLFANASKRAVLLLTDGGPRQPIAL